MTSHVERMAAGDWYISDEAVLELQRERQTLMERYNASPVSDSRARRELLLELFGEIGAEVEVRAPVYVDYGSNVRIGNGVFLNYGCQLADVAPITIGDFCQVGPNVQLLTPVHPLDPQRRQDRWERAAPVTIGSNVWIGAGAIVCPGVTVGDSAVIGAGAVVTRDVPPGVLAVGNPARVVRRLHEADDQP